MAEVLDKQIYVNRLKKIYKAKTGITLSDAEATEIFEKLLALVGTIYPNPIATKYDR